jgi:hypothetical protein
VSLTDYEKKIIANVERTGCHITCVFDPEGDDAPFAYSAGFMRSLGTGEVIIFGLHGDLMAAMINDVHDRVADGTLQLNEGVEIEGLLSHHVCVVRRVHPDRIVTQHFNSAIWFARTQMDAELTEAWQIFWPQLGTTLMPWDAHCSDEICLLQPALYEASAP